MRIIKKFATCVFNNPRGFTMLEVLISMSIFAVGILGLISSVTSVMHYQRHSKDMTLATMHATAKLEEIKRRATNEPTGGAYGFSYLVKQDGTGYTAGYTGTNFKKESSDVIDGYNRAWSLEIYPASVQGTQSFTDPGGIKMVEAVVTASWVDEKGETKSVEVATVLHRRQFVGGS